MRLGQDVLSDYARALETEWLLGNGRGGSASATVAGANTRRTHGLLVVAEPNGRLTHTLLRLEERIQLGAQRFDLGVRLQGTDPPRGGLSYLESFELAPWPIWRYRAGDVVLEKSLFLVHEHNAIAIRYRHLEGPSVRLTLSPVVVSRDPEALQHERPEWTGAVQGVPGRVQIECDPERPRITLWHSGAFMPARAWQRDLAYPADPYDDETPAREDAFVPCYLEAELAPGAGMHLVAANEPDLFRTLAVEGRLGTPPPRTLAECVDTLAAAERARLVRHGRDALAGADFTARQAAAAHGGAGEQASQRREPLVLASDFWTSSLASSLEQGVVRRGHRVTIARTLPLFDERGADTLRSVPALIALRAFDEAGAILRGAVEYLDEGLAAARFDPDGTPRYGDPSVALWLVHAGELLARRSEDLDLVRERLYPALESVIQFYRSGTRSGVRVRDDGLLASGEGDLAVTRVGENALWYHALVATAQLARLVGRKESGAFYLAWAREHHQSFNDRFWDEERGCLHPTLGPAGPEIGKTPDQILAASLAPSLLPPERASRLVATIEEELFTPLGLRERPNSPRVLTVWLGPFLTAYLRANGRRPEAQAKVHAWLEVLRTRVERGVSGRLPEAFLLDVNAPTTYESARAVWAPVSVVASAELLRAWIEDVDHVGEPAEVE
jgi:glycogen debranching enzyme